MTVDLLGKLCLGYFVNYLLSESRELLITPAIPVGDLKIHIINLSDVLAGYT